MEQSINIAFRGFVVLFLLCSIMVQRVSCRRGFFVVAHQCNSKLALRISVNAGANAVEMDMQFDKTTGRPTHFYHGSPCDCTCYVIKNKLNPFYSLKENICRLQGPCTQKGGFTDLLNYVLTFPSIALVYLDSKIDPLSEAVQVKAAKYVIDALSSQLFGKGYRGKVLIGSMQPSEYIKKLSEYAAASPYTSRIYITIDDTHDDPAPVINYMKSLHIPNIVVSNGITACHPKNVPTAIETAAAYRTRGEVCSVFAWTIDKSSSFDMYYRSRVNGILTNKVPALVRWARKKNLRLATPGDDSLNCKEREVETCGCTYTNGGCVVSLPAPEGRACHCNKDGSTCKGVVVTCSNLKSQFCTHPGTTIQHCVQGHGNCDGYKGQQCDCKRYWFSGCYISQAAPRFTACRCSFNMLTGCHGHVVRCMSPESRECKNPDKSYNSCYNAGSDGNCGGY